jgi:hypothetical protein
MKNATATSQGRSRLLDTRISAVGRGIGMTARGTVNPKQFYGRAKRSIGHRERPNVQLIADPGGLAGFTGL